MVADQVGVPTTSKFIANQIKAILPNIKSAAPGIYHLVPDGSCSWYGFAKAILREVTPAFDEAKIFPIKSEDFHTKAKRPMNSILDNCKTKATFMLDFDDWQTEQKKMK